MLDEFLQRARVAYFSMEIALRSEIPTYAGGLGVLAGDTLRSAADLSLPLVAVTLVSRRGYFRQELDAEGRQIEHPAPWDPASWALPLDAKVAVRIEDRPVWVGAWQYVVESDLGGRAPVILLDTDLAENLPADREITHYLYGGDQRYRLMQEMVLGLGGVRLLQALGFEIEAYHMNEGHSALLGLELLRRFTYPQSELRPGESPYDLPRVRQLCRFTTHTPVEAGQDRFSYGLVQQLFHDEVPGTSTLPLPLQELQQLGGRAELNMTQLALSLSDFVNGVAKRHAEVSARMYPGYQVRAITNGAHPHTWTAPAFRALYDRHVAGWCHEPELLMRAADIPDAEILAAHLEAKRSLIERVRQVTGVALGAQALTLSFARRMTAYKRPELLFTDCARLEALARRWPLQIVLAGKAHPQDEEGRRLVAYLNEQVRALRGKVLAVYLPDYDFALAQLLVSGSDLWLNTPLPPLEASGTSGMKAAFNGVPSLSVLDGWWVEGCIESVTGWSIDSAADLYARLENSVLPLFHGEPGGWVRLMKGAITRNAVYFNSHRMMRRYAAEAYLR